MCLLVSVYICFGEHVYRLSFCVTLSFDKIDNNNNNKLIIIIIIIKIYTAAHQIYGLLRAPRLCIKCSGFE